MQHRAVRLFLAILIFSLFSFSLSADINLFTGGAPASSIQWAVDFPISRDLRNPAPAEELILAVDYGELRADSGIKYQCNQFDFTNHISYMPTFNHSFQAGFGGTWHFYRYLKEFTENDLIVTARFRWMRGPVFSFENAAGFLFKFTTIDVIREYKPLIYNFSYHFSLLCNWHLFNKTDLWCALNLQDYFDYPLAISPFFKLGFNFYAAPDIVLGLDYSLKFVDMFFSAIYLNETVLRFSFKVLI